jgi:hypothetical protein
MDWRLEDNVRESSFSQAVVEVPRKIKTVSNEKFIKMKLEKEDIQETKHKSYYGDNCLHKLGFEAKVFVLPEKTI